jgi:hypothetical protein
LDVPDKEALDNTVEVPVEGFDTVIGGVFMEAICMDFIAGFNFNDLAIRHEIRV